MMTLLPMRAASLAAVTLFSAAFSLQAEVKLPAIFGDHMVLQEGVKLPVWGTASPGEEVTVTVGKDSAKTKAGEDGKWKVELSALKKGSTPTTMTVAGANTVTFSDVLVGDVWICSGQSNMEFNLGGGTFGFGGASNVDKALPAANDPELRFFIVTKKVALEPQADVAQPAPPQTEAQKAVAEVTGKWVVCTPATVGYFSAVGYFFGKDLRAQLKKPIGLIGTYWGGTPAEAWTSIEKLRSDAAIKMYADSYDKIRAEMPAKEKDFPAQQAAYKEIAEKWKKEVGDPYDLAMKAWTEDAKKAAAEGKPAPAKPTMASQKPRPPVDPNGGSHGPANLFNGMIAPIIPYAIKGAIWYQGESNAGQPTEYASLFPDMITDWRTRWNQGDFPFFFVQLASYKSSPTQNWPFLREAQLKTLSLPNTGMAVAADVGDVVDIHPKDKQDVGDRLALVARKVAYGDKKVVYSGPIYDKMTVKNGSVHLTFTNKGSGLIIGSAPWVTLGATPLPTTSLLGFTIAGEDLKFVPAEAKIVGDEVVVSAAGVAKPTAVRYGWANIFEGNLYNKEGLPASPFRTDTTPYDAVAAGSSPTPTPSPSPAAK